MLFRSPAPTVEDLALTAEGMVEKTVVKGYLQAVAKSFSEVYQNQAPRLLRHARVLRDGAEHQCIAR